ncbi:MAG: hypothetical protein OEY22_11545 [Candidatus Bathyarchaeota archaeon]|nr:hypothetical protein [Candidatus Bathyarchaeota archaeon]
MVFVWKTPFFPLNVPKKHRLFFGKALFFCFTFVQHHKSAKAKNDDGKFPIKSEEICMIENPQSKGMKHMKLNFYLPTDTSKRIGGERNIHFKFIDHATEEKRMRKKEYKKRYEYKIKSPLLETLNSCIEASRCRTLDKFIGS